MLLQNCRHFFSNPARHGARLLSTRSTNTIEVCFLDPKTVYAPDKNQAGSTVEDLTASGAATVVQVPQTFLPDLPKAHQEMGDFDDPMNEWAWGRRGEIFEYNLLGSHSTQSGFTSVILKPELQRVLAERRSKPVAHVESWRQLVETLRKEDGAGQEKMHPFLFIGHILESARATVYALQNGKEIEGLLVSSASADDE
mmetsp:Transcript_20036/g.55776  ORF Transcript_20036/g.55776 Transcript_20036/m.55776 type:complete len:198 (+) Transcript_20036:43-636(+)